MEENEQKMESRDTPNKSNAYIVVVGVLLVAAIVILVFAKGSKKPSVAGDATQNNPISEELNESNSEALKQNEVIPIETTTDNTLTDTNSSSITVEGGMFYFKPNEIRVKKNQPVKIVFKNVKGTHDFVIDELSVKTKMVKSGETDIVEFIPEKAGTFEFYCSVGNHRAMGMKGTIIVE